MILYLNQYSPCTQLLRDLKCLVFPGDYLISGGFSNKDVLLSESEMDNTENALCQNRELNEILEAQATLKCGLYLMSFSLNVPRLYLLNHYLFNWVIHYSISQVISDMEKLLLQRSVLKCMDVSMGCICGLMYLNQNTESKFLFQVLSLIKLIDKRLHMSFLISFKDTEIEEKAADVGILMVAILTNHHENTCLET